MQAADCFQEAAACIRVIGKIIMAYEAELGLAELHRRRGALAAASALVKPILPQGGTAPDGGQQLRGRWSHHDSPR